MKGCVGIDEVGRGPLAGPVTVCAVQWLNVTSPDTALYNIRDSKKLSPKKRAAWLRYAVMVQGKGVHYAVHSIAADVIDQVGITDSGTPCRRCSTATLTSKSQHVTHICRLRTADIDAVCT